MSVYKTALSRIKQTTVIGGIIACKENSWLFFTISYCKDMNFNSDIYRNEMNELDTPFCRVHIITGKIFVNLLNRYF